MELITGLLHDESFNLKSIENLKAEIKKTESNFNQMVEELKASTFAGQGLEKLGTVFTWKNTKTNEEGVCVIGNYYEYYFDENIVITSYCNTLLKLDLMK